MSRCLDDHMRLEWRHASGYVIIKMHCWSKQAWVVRTRFCLEKTEKNICYWYFDRHNAPCPGNAETTDVLTSSIIDHNNNYIHNVSEKYHQRLRALCQIRIWLVHYLISIRGKNDNFLYYLIITTGGPDASVHWFASVFNRPCLNIPMSYNQKS